MPGTAEVFALLPLLLFVGPLSPFMRTILSNSVPPEQQAQIFAAFSALQGIAGLAGPIYSASYSLLVEAHNAWVIFELMAVAALAALIIVTYVRNVPHLAKHLPELPEHGAGVELVEEDPSIEHPENEEDPLQQGLLGQTLSRRSSRTSRASTDGGGRLMPLDTSTLLFRHLAHTSVASEAEVRASRSTDGHSNITSRLLAEQHKYDYE